MRIRKVTTLFGVGILIVASVLLYLTTDWSLSAQDNSIKEFPSNNWVHVADVLRSPSSMPGVRGGKLLSPHKPPPSRDKLNACVIPSNEADTDIEMMQVYKELKFDNIDGGVWKQGWNVVADKSRWNSNSKLKVIVVPHSHNDPGWIKTFDDYYSSSTRNILNSMLDKLSGDIRKKFIWAEISYFSQWWNELSAENQRKVQRIVQNGQLEIVTGGWVMNDEANSHYYSIITQLTEGHQWVSQNLKVKPKNSWCIDPFGKSATMPIILKKMGLKNLVIQRVHYSIKKYLAQTKNLEFRWRQHWDNTGRTDLMTHMMPFYSYDIPHTCGPDPKVCCQFDFKRLPGHGLSCPWRLPPQTISDKNVAARAQILLDQYQKKAELYRTNAILVPLGDDFRYEYPAEWDAQFENYYRIFEHYNSHPELNVEAKFGTLEDFFTALMTDTSEEEFPSLSGDFFTYADRGDHYWSGYYTSRPFYKRMDRVLISYLKAAEIAFALAWSSRPSNRSSWLLDPHSSLSQMLQDSRRALSLFQHHDAVTGTARDHVVEDYGRRLLEAVQHCQHVLQQVSHFLLSPTKEPYIHNSEQSYFDLDDHRRSHSSLPERKLLIFRVGESKRLVFFNSLGYERKEIVSVHAFCKDIMIQDGSGNIVYSQTNPIFSQGSVMETSRYEILFIAHVAPFGIHSYTITHHPPGGETGKNILAKVKLQNSVGSVKPSAGFESLQETNANEFSIENDKLRAAISENGQLKSLTLKKLDTTIPLHLDFVRYLARGGSERSGAYLFLPSGEAMPVREESPLIRIVEGPLLSYVDVIFRNVHHTVTLYNTPGAASEALEIVNLVDITQENNFELAMRLSSRIRSLDEFYTDINGFQMMKRKRLAKIPIQGNFYPLPAAAYIEDDQHRLTILTAQPLGVSSLKEGQLEIIQDRKLQQDDNRGLGQGVTDNVPITNVFRILPEVRSQCKGPRSILSATGHAVYDSLHNPLITQIWKPETPCDLQPLWTTEGAALSPDVELASVRTLDEDQDNVRVGLVFHRKHSDVCFHSNVTEKETAQVNIHKVFPNNFGSKIMKTSLSYLIEETPLRRTEDLPMCHMDLLALTIQR